MLDLFQMRRLLITAIVFCCTGIYCPAQTVVTEKGLTKLVYNTSDAIVTVYLPDDFQNGDKISGTFNVFNEGIAEEQLQKSLTEVRKYKFNFSNSENQTNVLQRLVNVQPNQLTNLLPIKIYSSLILTLTESTGIAYTKELKPIEDPILPIDGCVVPMHILSGESLRIIGTFDGNASNTRVRIGNIILPVLAESPRQCIVEVPVIPQLAGKVGISILEDLKPKCSATIFLVKMVVGYDRIKVKKGETAQVTLTIKGLEDLKNTALLLVENTTPSLINLKDGNKQQIDITPGMITPTGDLKMKFNVEGIASGEFMLDFKLKLIEDFPDIIER